MESENFCVALRKVRKIKGLTQQQLGKMVGVSATAISQYENGSNDPSPEVYDKLNAIFGEGAIPSTERVRKQAAGAVVAAQSAELAAQHANSPYVVVQALTGPQLAIQVNEWLLKGYMLRGPMLVVTDASAGLQKALFVQNMVSSLMAK